MKTVNQLQAYNKLWAAVISSVLSLVITIFTLNVDPVVQTAIVTVVTGFFVYLIPNR